MEILPRTLNDAGQLVDVASDRCLAGALAACAAQPRAVPFDGSDIGEYRGARALLSSMGGCSDIQR